ncbi:MAG: arginine--tRNA ligase [Pseudomonadota bacterium]
MNIFAEFRERLIASIHAMNISPAVADSLAWDRITAEPPRDASHGDIASNIALVLAKPLSLSPRDLAADIVKRVAEDKNVEDATVAGPGFINLKISPAYWQDRLRETVLAGADFGRSAIGQGTKVNVEYVSANPTGPMHVGHCRGAVVGDALANLLDFAGYDVTKEYYINDAGSQIDVLARSALLRYREALGEDIGTIPEGLYPGDYLVPVGEKLASDLGNGLLDQTELAQIETVKPIVIDMMMERIKDDLAALNVRHDVFFSERTLHAGDGGRIRTAINDLTMHGYVYKGKLPPPKGKPPEEWEDREQTLFRSTDVGDDMDRPLVKSDGSYTYFAADVAYFADKFKRGFKQMIFVLGADHGGYVKRMEALANATAGDNARLSVLLCQLVKLMRNGEPVKMSKRSGQFETLRDVVNEVGRDPVRFMMLYRKSSEPLEFDFAKVTEQSKDNPVFYVQYASARCHSIFRQAAEQFHGDIAPSVESLHLLEDEGEIALVRKVAEFPRVVEQAASSHEPHRIAFYLYDLASQLHAHWNRGTTNDALRFIKVNNPELTSARLALAQGVLNTLVAGLTIIGVAAPEEMR